MLVLFLLLLLLRQLCHPMLPICTRCVLACRCRCRARVCGLWPVILPRACVYVYTFAQSIESLFVLFIIRRASCVVVVVGESWSKYMLYIHILYIYPAARARLVTTNASANNTIPIHTHNGNVQRTRARWQEKQKQSSTQAPLPEAEGGLGGVFVKASYR